MKTVGSYPKTRLRRLRKSKWLRNLVSENNISNNDLVLPIFIREGKNKIEQINSYKNVYNRITQSTIPTYDNLLLINYIWHNLIYQIENNYINLQLNYTDDLETKELYDNCKNFINNPKLTNAQSINLSGAKKGNTIVKGGIIHIVINKANIFIESILKLLISKLLTAR